ncbi:MAG: hypothetical protein ABI477_20100 [Chryseolinea sp.]
MDSAGQKKMDATPGSKSDKPQWSSLISADIAGNIASRYGVYCGPASIVWIAAVWNSYKGRPYPYLDRITDKKLFPDGPRPFTGYIPGFQLNLSDLLRRETQGDLRLSDKTYFQYDRIDKNVCASEMPMIIRIPSMSFKNGLHYVTLFKSESSRQMFNFHFQDNGVYKSDVKLIEGLGILKRRKGVMNIFPWGAKQVVKV